MPNIDLSGITEASNGGGGGYHLAPGGYVLKVIDYEVQFRRQYVRLKFDVDEGPCAGMYANAMWPISDIMSWSDKSLPYLKSKLRAFSESNEGWDAVGAFQRDAWQEFVGRRIGAIVRDRLYVGRDGSDKTGNEIYQLVSLQTIASGDFVVPGPKDDRKGAEQAAPNPPASPQFQRPVPAPMPTPQYQQPAQPAPLPWE